MTEYNKVVYDGQTLIDLTQDDVTASDVRSGVYFHSADGVRGQGTLTSTSIPTADTIAEWDSDAHMNSEDMTSQEVEDFVDGLNVSGVTAVDYIVEQSTSGIWTYRKWNSGIAECWGINTYSPTWSTYTSGSGLYISSGLSQTTPFTIYNGVAKVDIEAAGSNLGWSAIARFSDNNTVSFACIRNGNSGTCRASIYCIGTWK